MPNKSQQRSLWLKVIQGDMRSIGSPEGLKRHFAIYPNHRLVAIDTTLLALGVFVGRSAVCHLRLKSLHDAPPQCCLRIDEQARWFLTGQGGSLFVNGDLIGETEVELKIDDQIIADPYVFKIVTRPERRNNQDASRAKRKAKPNASGQSDANFVLNLSRTAPNRNRPGNDRSGSVQLES